VKNVLTSFQVFVVPKSEFGAPPQDMAQWVDRVDVQLTSEDDDGHGPDVGGEEWAYSISHKLKLPKEVKPLSKEWVVAVNTAIEEANK